MITSPGEMTASIRIQLPTTTGTGVNKVTTWTDIGNLSETDPPRWLFAKWEGVHGSEAWVANSVQATSAATISVWYDPEINCRCRVLDDTEKVYEIVSLDDVRKRHEQIELKVKASVNG